MTDEVSNAIERKRGDTYADEFVITKNGQPIDITGASFLLTVDPTKNPTTSANNLYQLVGVVSGTPPNQVVSFAPTASQANQLGKFFYDLQMTLGGVVRTVVLDKYTYVQDITK